MKKRAGKKVEGSDYGEVPVEGLKQARAGEKGKSKSLDGKIPNRESRTPKEAAPRKLVKPEYGDITIQIHGEKEAKRFLDENS